MPFEDESFDLVVVVGTLQYLMEPSACIKDVARILKPGGIIIALVPGKNFFHFLIQEIGSLFFLDFTNFSIL